MKNIKIAIAAIILTILCSGSHGYAQSGPYFGQPDPGPVPQRFAPAKLPLGTWGITFTPDGNECFISLNVNNKAVLKTSKRTNNLWPDLTTATFSGVYHDMEPFITTDGKRLYFGSERPLTGAANGILHNWYVDRTGTGWSDPQPMDPPLKSIFMMYPSVANNGNMYFTGGDPSARVWLSMSRFETGQYQEPEKLSDSLNYIYWAAHPFIAPDESYIIFDGSPNDARQSNDLYISFRKSDKTWTRAKILPASINPAGIPFVSRDGKYFFFSKPELGQTMWMDAGFIEEMRELKGDYLGMAPPDTIPEEFGPPSLKATRDWWWQGSPVFSRDQTEMYFAKYLADGQKAEINFMKQVNGIWTQPAQAPFAAVAFPESNPFFSASGDTLYYYSERPGGPFFFVTRLNEGWSESIPLNIPIPPDKQAGMGFSMSRKGNLYLEFWTGTDEDLYYSYLENGRYITPQKLTNAINSDFLDWGTYIDPDERYLVFCSNRSGGFGETDLYISRKNIAGEWEPAQNMGEIINSETGGAYPVISPDGKYLFFISWKTGDAGYNPYWVKLDSTLIATGIHNLPIVLQNPELFQNYPNPVKAKTTIDFYAPYGDPVQVDLLDLTGRKLYTLINCLGNGSRQSVAIDLSYLEPGLYFYKLTTGKAFVIRQLIKL
ncbi:MAG: T9SS type A sorting domain-containing protein [Bacteroidota bacterium]